MVNLYDILDCSEFERLLKSQLSRNSVEKITVFDLKIVQYNRIELLLETYDYHGSWGWTFDDNNMVYELRECLRCWRKFLRKDLK